MKKYLFIFCLILYIALAKSQSNDIKKYFEYENAKLDKVTALAYWFFIPGGGSFYAKNNTEEAIFFLSEIAIIGWYITSDDKIYPRMTLAGMKFIELFETFKDIDNYNKQLQLKLELTSQMGHIRPSLMLSLHL